MELIARRENVSGTILVAGNAKASGWHQRLSRDSDQEQASEELSTVIIREDGEKASDIVAENPHSEREDAHVDGTDSALGNVAAKPATTLDHALAYLRAGISVIPVGRGGKKQPAFALLPKEFDEEIGKYKGTWKGFQEKLPTEEDAQRWWARKSPPGIGAVAGNLSLGGLEVIDFDNEAEAIFPQWKALVESEYPGLLDHVCLVQTPRPGYHVWLRCPEIEIRGNGPLAIDPTKKGADGKARTLIETRGRGGYALVPGSPGACHETGRCYEHKAGPSLVELQPITAEQREALHRCARFFTRDVPDQPAEQPKPKRKPSNAAARTGNDGAGLMPGEDFDRRGPDWPDILEPQGWAMVGHSGKATLWRRPGKDHSWSATTGYCHGKDGADLLRVFTSNAAPFEDGKAYGKFRAYALLNHNGDFKAAAKELAQQGYGDQKRPRSAATCGSPEPPGTTMEAEPAEKPEGASGSEESGSSVTVEVVDECDSLSVRVAEVLNSGGEAALYRSPDLLQEIALLRLEQPAEYQALRAELEGHVKIRGLESALKAIVEQVQQAQPQREVPTEEAQYIEQDGRLYKLGCSPLGEQVMTLLANFTARIVEEVVLDDGSGEVQRTLQISGCLDDGKRLPTATVPTGKYEELAWVIEQWGASAVIQAGKAVRDHVRAGIQMLSGRPPQRVVYTHTGWRLIDGQWCYLHAAGAIGEDGETPELTTNLHRNLQRFALPEPPKGARLVEAVRASLELLNGLGPQEVMLPVAASAYRAVLGPAEITVWILGTTGQAKSEVASLAQRHFGQGMGRKNLPTNWLSTSTFNRTLAFHAKDTLLVVDDYCPSGSVNTQRLQQHAEELMRGQGNGSGRNRCNQDGTMQASREPRGLLLATGEDTPSNVSILARAVIIKIDKDNINFDRLTQCQEQAASGLYAQAMAGYIQWLAPQLEAVQQEAAHRQVRWRQAIAASQQHARTPENLATLAVGFEFFLRFAHEVGAITSSRQQELQDECLRVMRWLAGQQAETLQAESPARRFVHLIGAALRSGRAHLAAFARPAGSTEQPANPTLWGWRARQVGTGTTCIEWQPQGTRIGWLEEGESAKEGEPAMVYLDQEAAYATVQELARTQGGGNFPGRRILWSALREKELLATWDERGGKVRNTVRRTIAGQQLEVLAFRATAFVGDEA